MSSWEASSDRQDILQVRTPGDLVAILPYLIGFHPSHSLCAAALVAGRVDGCTRVGISNEDGEAASDVLRSLAYLCDCIAIDRAPDAVALVGYGPGREVTPAMAIAIRWVEERGMRLLDAVRVDDERFWSYHCTDPACCPPEGRPVDRAAPIAVEAVAQGASVLASRDEVAALVAANAGAQRAAMVAATETARTWFLDALADLPLPQARLWSYREGHRRLRAAIETYAAGDTLTDADAARLSVLLGDLAVRDVAWILVNAAEVETHRALWCDMTRRAVDNVEACASLAAFAGYMDGDGALANLALDRAFAASPQYAMAGLVRTAIDTGFRVAKEWPFQTLEDHAAELAASYGDDPAVWLRAIAHRDDASSERAGQ